MKVMLKKTRIIIILFITALIGGSASAVSSGDATRKADFVNSAFYTSGPVETVRDDALWQLFPGLVPFSVCDGYLYWVGESGKVELISQEETTAIEETNNNLCSKEEAALSAERLFDKAFGEIEKQFGNTKRVQVAGGETGDYLFTINLLWKGRETGNSASVTVSKHGKITAAAFIYGEKTVEELENMGKLTEEEAICIAKDSIRTYTEEKEQVLTSDDDYIEVENVEYRVFRGTCYYIVKGQVVFAKQQVWWTYDMPFEVHVDADTGECIEVATILE